MEIDDKDSKTYDWGAPKFELWLLMFVDPENATRWTDPTGVIATGKFTSKKFSRVFLLHDGAQKIGELSLSNNL